MDAGFCLEELNYSLPQNRRDSKFFGEVYFCVGNEARYAKELTNASRKTFFLKFHALFHYLSTTNEKFVISLRRQKRTCAKVRGISKKKFF